MKSKKIIFILCLTFALLSIACVSAGDADDIAVQTGDDVADEISPDSSQGNLLGVSNENVLLTGSSKDLQNLINNVSEGGTLDLSQDYKVSGGDVKISKNITINGNNHVLDEGSNSRIRLDTDGISVVLKNIIFKNGKAGDGGAILNKHSSSSLTLVNCQFISNDADDNGGAVYTKGNLYVDGCTFKLNTVDDDDGGAICALGKITVIKNSIFSENENKGSVTRTSNGGAIYSKNSLTIDSCTFEDNMADDNGGAIYANGDLEIRYSTFKDNKVDDDNGGAVYCTGNLYVYHSIFDSNKAYVDGGAVFCEGKTTAVISIFKNNKASGAVQRCFGGAIRSKGICNLTGCDFENNYAEDYGGAIYADGNLYIYGQRSWDSMEYNTWNLFSGNKAVNYGGAVYVKGNFYTNLGKGTSQERDYQRVIGLRTIQFEHNSVSEDDGGAVYCCGNAYINDAFFNDCSAKVDGGAVYCEGKTNITSSGFDNNKASGATQRCFGGAVRSEGTCYIDSSMFTENYVEDYGGAVYADDNIYISNDCYFYYNTAENYGGAIYAEDNVYINWDLKNTKMALIGFNEVKTDDGGGIYVEDNVFINNAKFEECFAKIDGGAIYCKGKSSLKNSIFYDNSVKIKNSLHLNYGGAICSKGSCTVDSCSFDINSAYDRGGAIYCYGKVSINNSKFEANYAENYGGAVYADTIDTISNTLFRFNTANTDDGGAVYINSKCTTTVTGCSFENNEAGDEGGGIYTDSAYGKVNLYSNIFVGNKAGDKGHAVYNSGEFGTVNGNWYGSNNPNFKSLLKIFHWIGSDSDYKDSHYAQIFIKINDTDLYMRNPYKVTVYFKNKDGKDITKELHWYDATFSGDGKFLNHKTGFNEVTTDVVFSKENPTIQAKMNDQVLKLNLNVKSKTPSSVNITSCPDVYCPNALNVTFKIENRSSPTYVIKDSKGKIIKKGNVVEKSFLSVENLTSSNYSITISNPESLKYFASSATAYFTVYPQINVEVSANNVSYGQNTTITLKNNMDGLYYLDIDDVGKFDVEVVDGVGVKELQLDAGEYHTTTTYSNDNYTLVVSEARFVVKKSLIHMNMVFDETYYPNNLTGVIITDAPGIYNIKNDTYDFGMFNVTESPYKFNLGQFTPGKYYISAFSTDPNYEPAGVLVIVDVHPGELNMSLYIPDIVYGDDVIATVHSDAADTFLIKIGDFEREVNVSDLDLNTNIGPDWDIGTYNATLVFKGNEYYAPGTYNTSFEVLKDETPSTHKKLNARLITPDRVIHVSDAIGGYEYSIILKDENGNAIADSDVVITFNNRTYTARTGSDGWLSVNLTANEAGSYEVNVEYWGDYEHNSVIQSATIKVVKESVQFLAPDRAVYLSDISGGYTYQAILKSKDGKPLANRKVLVTFNGKKQVAFTDEKGYVTVNLTADKVGSYRVDFRFAGDRYYNELGSYRTIRVV